MRKYEPYWNRLKEKKAIQITAPADSHKTIIQALRKESHKDTAFRFKCLNNKMYYELSICRAGDVIYAEIIYKVGYRSNFVSGVKRHE